MKPFEITAVIAASTMSSGLVWSLVRILRKEVTTLKASWLVSSTALFLSLFTYLTSSKASAFGASLNAVSAIAVGATFIAVSFIERGRTIALTSRQVFCMKIAAAITVFWIVSIVFFRGTGFWPNICTQALLVISYGMLIEKYWKAREHKESMINWWCVFVASCVGVATGLLMNDVLTTIYAVRSVIMCGILLFVLCRIDVQGSFIRIPRRFSEIA